MDEQAIGQLCQIVEALIDRTEAFEKSIAELRSVVFDELIGGISKLYGENMRVEKVEGLKGKFGDLFKDSEAAYGTLTKGNLWEDLADELEGVADTDVEPKVKTLAADLLDRINAIKGKPEAVEVEAAVEEPKAEEPAEPEEPDPMDGVKAAVADLKKRGR